MRKYLSVFYFCKISHEPNGYSPCLSVVAFQNLNNRQTYISYGRPYLLKPFTMVFSFNSIQHPLFQFLTFHIIFSLLIQESFNFTHSNGFSFNTLPHTTFYFLFLFNFIFLFL